MASPTLTPSENGRLTFKKDKKFLAGNVDATIEVDATKSPAVAAALAQNTPFPPGNILLGSIKAGVSGGSDITFGGNETGRVSFRAGGGARTGFGVYTTPVRMLKDLDLDSRAVEGIDFQDLGAARFVAFHWGYDLSGAANGSVALAGGVGVNFGVEGSRDALYAVIRVFKQDPNARTAIADTLDSWKLPRQVKSIEDLDPGTWILTEVNGAFGFKLGAQVGYDYNWIRNVQLKGLTGDVGLRIQAAAEVALGFDVSGKFAVVVGRESLDQAEQKVRLRLYKMRKKGWNFALNAGVDVTPSTGELLPEQLDDFIAGVFGVHGAQIVEDLREIRK